MRSRFPFTRQNSGRLLLLLVGFLIVRPSTGAIVHVFVQSGFPFSAGQNSWLLFVGLFKSGRLTPKKLLVVRLLIFAVGRSSLLSLLPLLSLLMGVVVPFWDFTLNFCCCFSLYARSCWCIVNTEGPSLMLDSSISSPHRTSPRFFTDFSVISSSITDLWSIFPCVIKLITHFGNSSLLLL